ncbi:MAG: fatty-acid synthase [Armatimonadota bacterium]|nr:fatty-acid synthase [Armatimonadota bacterium]
MPVRDAFHEAVVKALLAAGWTITDDPLTLPFGVRTLFVDLGAQSPLAAEKAGRKIAVEVKSFLTKSPLPEWERAIGQYLLYSFLLRRLDPERVLFLAVPDAVFRGLLSEPLSQDFIAEQAIKLIVVSKADEVIEKWIE